MLQEDGRMLYKDIAQGVGVSLPTVRSRIQRLVELGVIKKFTVIVDADKILGKVRGVVLLQVSPSEIEKVMARLTSMKEVREVYKTAGSSPLVLKVEARDLDGLGQLVSNKLSGIDGITAASSLIVTKSGKEEYGASVEADAMVQFKCSFCNAPILGRPYIEYIDGGRYYFNAEDCATAYKQRLRKGQKQAPESA
jgi:Lrp/AsnC family transcriptional regulator for asnA, asnC and gidA